MFAGISNEMAFLYWIGAQIPSKINVPTGSLEKKWWSISAWKELHVRENGKLFFFHLFDPLEFKDKMTAILQTAFSNAFPGIEAMVLWLEFH